MPKAIPNILASDKPCPTGSLRGLIDYGRVTWSILRPFWLTILTVSTIRRSKRFGHVHIDASIVGGGIGNTVIGARPCPRMVGLDPTPYGLA